MSILKFILINFFKMPFNGRSGKGGRKRGVSHIIAPKLKRDKEESGRREEREKVGEGGDGVGRGLDELNRKRGGN